jgi:DNA repair protein RecO (recombination protein O)
MALVTTPAVLLHAFPYGETSKIVRLLTPEHGIVSAIAKGARREKSRFGARLQPMSEGTAQIYLRHGRELQTLAEFDLQALHPALAADVRRYAAATAVAEIVIRCAPAEGHAEIHAMVRDALTRLETVPVTGLPATALRTLWSVVAILGFAPSLDTCARDGRPVRGGAATFSVADGGVLCPRCARGGGGTTTVPAVDRAQLERWITGDGEVDEVLDRKRAAAHLRLLLRFVERHVSEGAELKALALWQSLQ